MAVSIAFPSVVVSRTQVRFGFWAVVYTVAPMLAALFGLYAGLDYARAPEVMRPIFDDSYISLEFAKNLLETGKLTLDGENWSTGATSPLHVAVMALVLDYGVDPIETSIGVGVASHALLAVAVYALAWSIFHNVLAGLFGAAAISVTAMAALDAGNGLETSLFMALIAGSMAAFFIARHWYSKLFAGLLIGLTVLTRPEGAFLLPAVFLYRFFARERGEPILYFVRDAFLLCLPGTIALGFLGWLSMWVNGSLSGTATAKLSFFQEDTLPFNEKLNVSTDAIAFFLGPSIMLIAVGAVAARRREVVLFALFWAPILVFYVLLFPGGLSHYFYRYQHPVLPFIAVLAGGGAATLLAMAMQRNFVAKLALIAGLAIVVVAVWSQYDRWRLVYRDASYETYVDLESMVFDLNTILEPDDVLATHDIGVLAYYGDFKVLDLVGLVNPDVVPFHKEREVRKYVEEVKPDYLLIFPEWDFYFLRIDPGGHPERYELLKVYPGRGVRILPYLLYRATYPAAETPEPPQAQDVVGPALSPSSP
jgi:hypothetical protein